MDAKQAQEFLVELVGAGAAKAGFEKVENEKRAAVENAFSTLTPKDKDDIREGMTFTLVNKRGWKQEKSFSKDGQENAIDTFGSVKKGHGISGKDQPKVQKAMESIVKLTRPVIDKLKDLKKPDGTPVYDLGNEDKAVREKAKKAFTDYIEHEVFTPLVREGLIPETFVLNDFSEVQKLLDNTFKSYTGTMEDARSEKELADGRMESDFHGAGGAIAQLKGTAAKGAQLKEHLTEKAFAKTKLTKERREKIAMVGGIAKQGAKTGVAIAKAYINVAKWVPDQDGVVKAVETEDKFLHPEKYIDKMDPGRVGDLTIDGVISPDSMRIVIDQQKRQAMLESTLGAIGKWIDKDGLTDEQMRGWGTKLSEFMDTVVDSNGFFYTKSSIEEVATMATEAYAYYVESTGIKKADEIIDGLKFAPKARVAAADAVKQIDAAIVAGLGSAINPIVGELFEGFYADEVDLDEVQDSTAPDTDGLAAMKALAAGFEKAFEKAAPTTNEPLFSTFAGVGKKIGDAFLKAAPIKEFEKGVTKDPTAAFKEVVAAAKNSISAGVSKEFKELVQNPQTMQAIMTKSAIPNEVEALDELEKSEEELKEYERMLVLIDEGGIDAAEQRSIEVLIAQLEKDRQILEIVAQVGSTLDGVGGGAVNIANWATDSLTDVVAGNILGPLKAAKLIMQLAVNVKKAADRWALWAKFKTDLKRSKVAVSSLTSTIQGFFDNKKDQIAFRTVEDALIAVQAASAILGSVPEPYSMAIGKTMGLVAGAAQEALKFSEMIYTEAKLAAAWKITKEAMNNPSDRAAGLKALRLNPTLGMHALAWAGMEKQPPDPVARMTLGSLGLNEQTLAVSGSEKKVREYLETLLNEDRVMVDPDKLKTDWALTKVTLTVQDWFVSTSRASKLATPKLRLGGEKVVLEALKKASKHQPEKWMEIAEIGAFDPSETKRITEEAKALCDALNSYDPVADDGTFHGEMSCIADEFLKLAAAHRAKIEKLDDVNKGARDPGVALRTLKPHLDRFETLFGQKNKPLTPTFDEKETKKVEQEIKAARVVEVRYKKIRALDDNKIIQDQIAILSEILDRAEDATSATV